jgi:hypothetical protein
VVVVLPVLGPGSGSAALSFVVTARLEGVARITAATNFQVLLAERRGSQHVETVSIWSRRTRTRICCGVGAGRAIFPRPDYLRVPCRVLATCRLTGSTGKTAVPPKPEW